MSHSHSHHPQDSGKLSIRSLVFRIVLAAVIVGLLVTYSMTFQVAEGFNAVVTRFGDPVASVQEAGLGWKWPWPIERAHQIDMRRRHFNTPYTATFNDYVRTQLEYETDTVYEILSFKVNEGWEYERGAFPDTSELLRSALAKNPYMKVLIGQGFYDLATPHFAAQYTFTHMDIDPEAVGNIRNTYYEAGHMFYLDIQSLAKLKDDVRGFLQFG